MIPGEELTDAVGDLPIHVVAIGLDKELPPQHGHDVAATVRNNVDAIAAAGGIAQVAHPNFRWSFSVPELATLGAPQLLEIYNGHPGVNNWGGRTPDGQEAPSMEAVWDQLLSQGLRFYAVATDDAHNYLDYANDKANPGRGWIVARAESLGTAGVMKALRAGRLLLQHRGRAGRRRRGRRGGCP